MRRGRADENNGGKGNATSVGKELVDRSLTEEKKTKLWKERKLGASEKSGRSEGRQGAAGQLK